MKRFLTFISFAMVIAATCFSLCACSSDDDDDNNKKVIVPTTAQQAIKMLQHGMWRIEEKQLDEEESEAYYRFKTDGTFWRIAKIREDVPKDSWCYDYRGKKVGYIDAIYTSINPNKNNPSMGYIILAHFGPFEYVGLTNKSVTLDGETNCTNVPNFAYREVDAPAEE